MMRTFVVLPLVAGFLIAGCGKDEEAKPARSSTSGGNPLTAPADYLGAVAKAKQSTDKTIVSAGLKQAINMFQAQEGRFPKDLNELLKPDYLNSIPPPPAGMKYSYNSANGELKVVPK